MTSQFRYYHSPRLGLQEDGTFYGFKGAHRAEWANSYSSKSKHWHFEVTFNYRLDLWNGLLDLLLLFALLLQLHQYLLHLIEFFSYFIMLWLFTRLSFCDCLILLLFSHLWPWIMLDFFSFLSLCCSLSLFFFR